MAIVESEVRDAAKPARRQVAALPVRRADDGSVRVLLVTSRESRRWIVPKGWLVKGMKQHEAAALEALEEAGVKGRISRKPVARYRYWKRLAGRSEFCEVLVHLLEVDEHLDSWREKGQRELIWLTPAAAADLVDEPGLCEAIRALA